HFLDKARYCIYQNNAENHCRIYQLPNSSSYDAGRQQNIHQRLAELQQKSQNRVFSSSCREFICSVNVKSLAYFGLVQPFLWYNSKASGYVSRRQRMPPNCSALSSTHVLFDPVHYFVLRSRNLRSISAGPHYSILFFINGPLQTAFLDCA